MQCFILQILFGVMYDTALTGGGGGSYDNPWTVARDRWGGS
jgi:hypothetical protein